MSEEKDEDEYWTEEEIEEIVDRKIDERKDEFVPEPFVNKHWVAAALALAAGAIGYSGHGMVPARHSIS